MESNHNGRTVQSKSAPFIAALTSAVLAKEADCSVFVADASLEGRGVFAARPLQKGDVLARLEHTSFIMHCYWVGRCGR